MGRFAPGAFVLPPRIRTTCRSSVPLWDVKVRLRTIRPGVARWDKRWRVRRSTPRVSWFASATTVVPAHGRSRRGLPGPGTIGNREMAPDARREVRGRRSAEGAGKRTGPTPRDPLLARPAPWWRPSPPVHADTPRGRVGTISDSVGGPWKGVFIGGARHERDSPCGDRWGQRYE